MIATRKVVKYEAECKKHGDAKSEADRKLAAARLRVGFLAKDPALFAEPAAVNHVRAGLEEGQP